MTATFLEFHYICERLYWNIFSIDWLIGFWSSQGTFWPQTERFKLLNPIIYCKSMWCFYRVTLIFKSILTWMSCCSCWVMTTCQSLHCSPCGQRKAEASCPPTLQSKSLHRWNTLEGQCVLISSVKYVIDSSVHSSFCFYFSLGFYFMHFIQL